MHNWFECKINYEKTAEDGVQKKVTEPYLVDALSFTEAEARIIEEMRPYISGEFTVMDIKRARYAETFLNDNGDRFYKVKINLVTLDEKSGVEKKTPVQMLAQASTLHDAVSVIDSGMQGTMADYVIASVVETALIDVFPFVLEVKTVKKPDEETALPGSGSGSDSDSGE
ncbi:MAG: DUF4494 domain-containing protein [Tannerella sp.]|jgi:hypothetical protein|nr:DUF4494 domain-containing protein [Tannerella sp.]